MTELQSNGNELGFVINVKLDELKKQLKEYDQRLIQMESNTEKATDSMSGMFEKLGKLAGAYFSVNMLKDFTQKLINVRGQFQQLEIAFGTMLGSQEKASKLMLELTETAAKTPFNLSDVAQGAKQLLAYGTASEEVNDSLKRLGNIASGLSIPLNDLVYLYGTTQTQGRLFTQDVRQFMGRGIPLVKELAKELGKTEEEINEMVSKGEIGFEHVRKVIENLTNEGGMFFNLMEKQSASLTGQISNLEDAFDSMLNEIGTATQDTLSKGISGIAYLVENYKTLGKILATIAGAYGSYKLALGVVIAIEKVQIIQKEGLIAVMKKQIIVQKTLNALTKVNPYVALATAVGAIATAVWAFKDNTDKLADAQERLNKKMEEFEEKQKSEAQKTSELIGVIQDKTRAIWEQVDAYNELQKYENGTKGMTIDEIRSMTKEQFDAKSEIAEHESRMKTLNEELNDAQKQLNDARRTNERLKAEWSKTGSYSIFGLIDTSEMEDRVKAAQDAINKVQIERKRREDEISEQKLSTEERLAKYEVERIKYTERRKAIEEELNEISQGDRDATTDIREGLLKKKLLVVEMYIAQYKDKEERLKKVDQDVAKNYIYWQKLKQKATEDYQNAEAFTPEFYDAQKRIDEATKQMDKWDEQLKKTKKEIEDLAKKWTELADASSKENELLNLSEFDRLRKENSNAYQDKVKELAKQRDEDIKNAGGIKSAIEKINKSYNTKVDNLAKAFEITNKKIDEQERDYLDSLNDSLLEYENTALQNEIKQIERQAEQQLKEIEEKFGTASSEYLKYKQKIEQQTDAKKEDAKIQSLITKEQRRLELKTREIELTKNLRGEEQAELDIMKEREESLEYQISLLEKQKNGLTEAEQIQLDELKAQLGQLNVDINIFQARIKDMRDILADMFGQIGSSASSSNNQVMSGIGSLFNGASSIFSNSKEIKAKMDAGDKSGAYAQGIASAVSGAVEMFNLIYDQAQANKQALADWDEAIRSSAQKLRMLEIEELNWKDRNIWGSADPYEKMNKSLEKANKASMMASDSLKKLADAQVQTGTKKVVDAKNTLQGTAIGAGIGASIGSIVPVIGTAIGTAVGAVAGTLAGLFAGRKEVAVYNSLQNQYGELYNKETLEINKQILADYDKMDEKTKKLIDDTKELLEAQKESLEEFKSYVIELTGDVSGGLSDSLVEAFSNNELYTAVDKFKEYMQTQIEGIIQSRVFSSVFGDMMDSLSKQLESGIISSEGAINGNIEEKLAEFPYRISELMGTYDYLMKSYQDIFKKGGYDLFKAQKEATQEALQGTISSMSEDTATKLNGNFMGLKLSAMEINQNVGTMRNLASEANEMMRSSLATMNRIAENTAFCQKLERLDELADDLSDMKRNGILVR